MLGSRFFKKDSLRNVFPDVLETNRAMAFNKKEQQHLQQPSRCHFKFSKIDPACPRFVGVRFGKFPPYYKTNEAWNNTSARVRDSFLSTTTVNAAGVGLGDRFLQMIVGLAYAIRLEGMSHLSIYALVSLHSSVC